MYKKICLGILFLLLSVSTAAAVEAVAELWMAPVEGGVLYPFEKVPSMVCGRWSKGSQDYPYFGAARNRYRRKHAGIDLYPVAGAGSLVRAVTDGQVVKVAPFYVRANGEVTYGVLVDHGIFVANYAELQKPSLQSGYLLKKGAAIGRVSGTAQLHFELYRSGTREWTRGWYGARPPQLLDPTALMLRLLSGELESVKAAELLQ